MKYLQAKLSSNLSPIATNTKFMINKQGKDFNRNMSFPFTGGRLNREINYYGLDTIP